MSVPRSTNPLTQQLVRARPIGSLGTPAVVEVEVPGKPTLDEPSLSIAAIAPAGPPILFPVFDEPSLSIVAIAPTGPPILFPVFDEPSLSIVAVAPPAPVVLFPVFDEPSLSVLAVAPA